MNASFAWGLLAALLAVVPAVLRLGSEFSASGLVVLVAATALWAAPLTATIAARPPLGRLPAALGVAALLCVAPLSVLARVLKATTHHRPLGGATFAVVALLLLIAALAVSARLLGWLAAARTQEGKWVARALLGFCLVTGLFAVALAVRSLLRGDDGLTSDVYDALRSLALVIAAAWLPARGRHVRAIARGAVLAWVCLMAAGVWLGRSPALAAELSARAPVLYAPLWWLGG